VSADVLVALDEDALLDALAAGRDVPVLPIGTGREYGGVPGAGRTRALDALAAGNYDVESRQTLSVTAGDRALRALADVTLVTTQVAQISEFAIRAEGRDVDTVRADGVVAATPSGSHGYAADAGGPLLASDTSAVAVVPIAPFRISRDRWVLAPPVSFTVVRDGPTVNLYVDGRRLGPVSAHEPVALDWGPVPGRDSRRVPPGTDVRLSALEKDIIPRHNHQRLWQTYRSRSSGRSTRCSPLHRVGAPGDDPAELRQQARRPQRSQATGRRRCGRHLVAPVPRVHVVGARAVESLLPHAPRPRRDGAGLARPWDVHRGLLRDRGPQGRGSGGMALEMPKGATVAATIAFLYIGYLSVFFIIEPYWSQVI